MCPCWDRGAARIVGLSGAPEWAGADTRLTGRRCRGEQLRDPTRAGIGEHTLAGHGCGAVAGPPAGVTVGARAGGGSAGPRRLWRSRCRGTPSPAPNRAMAVLPDYSSTRCEPLPAMPQLLGCGPGCSSTRPRPPRAGHARPGPLRAVGCCGMCRPAARADGARALDQSTRSAGGGEVSRCWRRPTRSERPCAALNTGPLGWMPTANLVRGVPRP